MSSGTPVGQPPPRPGPRRRLLRWWRSRDALSRLHRWLLLRALPVALAFLGLYVLNGALMGWTDAYNVLVGIDSPGTPGPPGPRGRCRSWAGRRSRPSWEESSVTW
ncbi:hypothetical protein KEF29_06890 [Streptomyces tuirus]|uniref:Uncharacterized protein n=1 Tax=Streptomyces tuirus TaxID=68278 RepID=A0A941FEZ1_9ACTN|nr:hypothetical protein [Streptomyces tuirus]